MSGTEKTLVYAALSVALATDAPLKIVIMDEFDIDADNFERLTDLLLELYRDGVIDQAVLAHTGPPGVTDPDLAVIPLGKA
jgi:hypothetical protein